MLVLFPSILVQFRILFLNPYKSAFSSTLLRQPAEASDAAVEAPTNPRPDNKIGIPGKRGEERELINFGRLFLFQIPMHFFEFLAQAYRRL